MVITARTVLYFVQYGCEQKNHLIVCLRILEQVRYIKFLGYILRSDFFVNLRQKVLYVFLPLGKFQGI